MLEHDAGRVLLHDLADDFRRHLHRKCQRIVLDHERNVGSDRFDRQSIPRARALALEQCGSDVTRENIMAQAANLKDVVLPTLLPGIHVIQVRLTTGR